MEIGKSRSHFATFVGLALGLAVTALSGNAPAVWPDLSVEELIEESALVGVFRVESADPTAYDHAEGRPQTRVVLKVQKLLYGKWPATELEFLLPRD